MIQLKLMLAGAAALIVIGAFAAGHMRGIDAGKVEQMKDTVEAVQNRGGIDAKVSRLDDDRLCVELGGVPDDCAQLRGLDTLPADPKAGPDGP